MEQTQVYMQKKLSFRKYRRGSRTSILN